MDITKGSGRGAASSAGSGAGRAWLLGAVGIALLLSLSVLHLLQGEAGLTAGRVIKALLQPSGTLEDNIVWTLRLPRTAIGILAGGALAVAGIILQSLTRNPLASASTLGINSGAYFMVVAASVFAPAAASTISFALALAGGAGAGLAAYLLSGGASASPVRMALSGMIVSLVLSSFTGALQLLFENQTQGLFLWGSGSLAQIDWQGTARAWPWIAGASIAAFVMARPLDMMALGDETAMSLGQNIKRVRAIGLLLAVLLAAMTVSVVGPIGFVGLVVPHLLRLLGLVRHRGLIPVSFIWGGALVIGADAIAMMFESSLGQLPVGAVTALVGGPWLIWLAGRKAKGHGGDAPRSGSAYMGPALKRVPFAGWLAILGALLIVIMIGGQAFGGMRLPIGEVFATVFGGGSELTRTLVLELRLPRTIVAAFAGAALAVSGLLLQGVVRNPLADPSVIGITQGAGVGVLALMVIWPQLGGYYLSAAAFAGSLLTAAAVYALSRRSGLQPAVVALVGMAVSAMGAAIINVLVIQSGLGAAGALAWLAGSTYARGWQDVPQIGTTLLVLLPPAVWMAGRLDVIQFSDASSSGLGLVPGRERMRAGFLGALLAAAALTTVGTVGFIGLIAPHAVRLMTGPRHKRLVPLSLLLGAILLALSDLLGRTVLAPKEIPSGLIAALIGAPYFLWLMVASQRRVGLKSKM